MKTDQTTINCPDCGSAIDVNELLKHQIEDRLRREYQEKQKNASAKLKEEQAKLQEAQEEFERKKERVNELFQERLEKEKKSAEKEIERKLKAKLEEEQGESVKALQEELNDKSQKLKDLHKMGAEIEKLKREKNEIAEAVEAEAQKKINALILSEREKIRQQEDEKNELKFKELQKQLEDQKRLTAEMKRKQEQGSMQLQGEVQELAIEEWLEKLFPLDTIGEIKKGANGADCLHTVNTREKVNCGSIYYESKRAKNFSQEWIRKFKEDMARKNAILGVIVTEVLPAGMERMGMVDTNIWVCTFPEFKGLCAVLRESVIAVSNVMVTQANKGEKMEMLYDYLTSPEFRHQLEGIKDAFILMQEDLEKEKRSTHARWKRQQKQIDRVMIHTTGMYGSLRGIAGSSVPLIEELEEVVETELLEEEL